VNSFWAADVVLCYTDWWVQGATLLATPAQRLQKTGHLIFPQLGSATPLCRVALLLLLVRSERQTRPTELLHSCGIGKGSGGNAKNRHLQTEYPKFIVVFFSLYIRMTGCCMMFGHDHFLRHHFHFFLRQPYLI
jgi:hypothetical protein